MSERAQIHIALSPEQKERWQGYADENPEYSSLSHLIRRSVIAEIEGRNDPEPSGSGGASEEAIRELHDEIRGLRNGLSDIGTTVHNIHTTVSEPAMDREARTEVFAALPKGEENAETTDEIAGRLPTPFDVMAVSHHISELRDPRGTPPQTSTPLRTRSAFSQ